MKKVTILILVICLIIAIVYLQKTKLEQKDYDQVYAKNIKQQEQIKKLEMTLKNSYIYTLGIPSRIVLSTENGITGTPYDIDLNSNFLMINGVIETVSKINHITNKTVLEHFKIDLDIEKNIFNKPYIKLIYQGITKKVMFSMDESEEVDELILWYDDSKNEVMITLLNNYKYYTHSLKGSYDSFPL